ncbi:myosin-G heavy chain-like [Oppia nitens]|uniref:myosin-G heavy chain-like n=1 Tax=Oppia nitens TaxID=1686743 RepID=UPI0023D9F77A|nr:myosin-G heavy chain-like [Oppia nitens]XP_054163456.1 myosin-G heavy chain-like [Oppia nitens]
MIETNKTTAADQQQQQSRYNQRTAADGQCNGYNDARQTTASTTTPMMISGGYGRPLSATAALLRRSTSAESVLMTDAYHSSGGGSGTTSPIGLSLMVATANHGLLPRSDRYTQTPDEWQESEKLLADDPTNKWHKSESVQKCRLHEQQQQQQHHHHQRAVVVVADQSTQSITKFADNSLKKRQLLIASGVSPTKCLTAANTTTTISGPIAIPTKLCIDSSRSANSVEELNLEIENLVLKGMVDGGGGGGGGSLDSQLGQLMCDKIPEGHRAPVFELLAIKTRKANCVPSSGDDSSDISQSESPIFNTELISSTNDTNDLQNHQNNYYNNNHNNNNNSSNYSMSPKINKFLTREPPDGCEKIKIVNESDDRYYNPMMMMMMNNSDHPSSAATANNCRPQQPSSSAGFVLLPSRSSAFLPILKPNNNDLTIADYHKNRINYRKS